MSDNTQTDYIRWFRSAAPYINAHRGQVFVVQFGGDLVEGPHFTSFVHDLVLLDALGIKLVLVHGARAQIDRRLAESGRQPCFAGDRRVTEASALPAVREASGAVRLEVEARLSMGLANSPMAGARIRVTSGNYITARPVGVRDGIDFHYTGEVRRVDSQALQQGLDGDQIVLLSPIGYSPTGEIFNVSSEEVATATAVALRAAKLVLVGGAAGRLLPQQLTLAEARRQLDGPGPRDGSPEQRQEVQRQLGAAVHACRNGVTRAHILDGRVDGALLLELFSRDGVGAMVSADTYDTTRQAVVDDVPGILELLAPLEREGVLVQRSRDKLEAEIGRFTLMERDGTVVACAALHPLQDTDSMELACLVVHPLYRKGERGDKLLSMSEDRARQAGARNLFVLTTHTAQWFMERGFSQVSPDALPVERRATYNDRRNSRVLSKPL